MNDRLGAEDISGTTLDLQVGTAVLTPFGQMLHDMDVLGLLDNQGPRPGASSVDDLRSNQLEPR